MDTYTRTLHACARFVAAHERIASDVETREHAARLADALMVIRSAMYLRPTVLRDMADAFADASEARDTADERIARAKRRQRYALDTINGKRRHKATRDGFESCSCIPSRGHRIACEADPRNACVYCGSTQPTCPCEEAFEVVS